MELFEVTCPVCCGDPVYHGLGCRDCNATGKILVIKIDSHTLSDCMYMDGHEGNCYSVAHECEHKT